MQHGSFRRALAVLWERGTANGVRGASRRVHRNSTAGPPAAGQRGSPAASGTGRGRGSLYIIGGPMTPLGCRCWVTRTPHEIAAVRAALLVSSQQRAALEGRAMVLSAVRPGMVLLAPLEFLGVILATRHIPAFVAARTRVLRWGRRKWRPAGHHTVPTAPCPYARAGQCSRCPWMAVASAPSDPGDDPLRWKSKVLQSALQRVTPSPASRGAIPVSFDVLEPLCLKPSLHQCAELNLRYRQSPQSAREMEPESAHRLEFGFTLFNPLRECAPRKSGGDAPSAATTADFLAALTEGEAKGLGGATTASPWRQLFPETSGAASLSTIHCMWATLEQQRLVQLLSQWSSVLPYDAQEALAGAALLQCRATAGQSAALQVALVLQLPSGAAEAWRAGEASPLWGPAHPPGTVSAAERRLVDAVLRAAPLLPAVEVLVCCQGHRRVHQLYPTLSRDVDLAALLGWCGLPSSLFPSEAGAHVRAPEERAGATVQDPSQESEVVVRRRLRARSARQHPRAGGSDGCSTPQRYLQIDLEGLDGGAAAHISVPRVSSSLAQLLSAQHRTNASAWLSSSPFWRHGGVLDGVLSFASALLLDGIEAKDPTRAASGWVCLAEPLPLPNDLSAVGHLSFLSTEAGASEHAASDSTHVGNAVAATLQLNAAVAQLMQELNRRSGAMEECESDAASHATASRFYRRTALPDSLLSFSRPLGASDSGPRREGVALVIAVVPPAAVPTASSPRIGRYAEFLSGCLESLVAEKMKLLQPSSSPGKSQLTARVLLLHCITDLNAATLASIACDVVGRAPVHCHWTACRAGVVDIDPVAGSMVAYAVMDLVVSAAAFRAG